MLAARNVRTICVHVYSVFAMQALDTYLLCARSKVFACDAKMAATTMMVDTMRIGQTWKRRPTIPTIAFIQFRHGPKLFEAIVSESLCLGSRVGCCYHFTTQYCFVLSFIYISYRISVFRLAALDLILFIVGHLRSNKLVYGVFLFFSRCRKFGAPEFRCRRAEIGVILEIHWHLCRYCGNFVDFIPSFCQAKNVCAKPSRQTNRQTNRQKKQ